MSRYRYPEPLSSEITPREVYLGRRRFLTAAGGVALGVAGVPPLRAESWPYWRTRLASAKKGLFSADDERVTRQATATGYNNFYEFGIGKADPAKFASRMRIDPWSVEISGEFERSGRFALEDVLSPHAFEERVYRLRCVEAWSMVIPWVGFPLTALLRWAGLTSRAKYIEFETLYAPQQMPGQNFDIIDWPYREALRIDEAMHPLTLLAVGMYGEALPNQNGAPLRLVVPWKYGFKSIKSIVAIRAHEQRPTTSWHEARPREYGFFANVNPSVRHPRWHQATERRLGERGRRRTEPFNGYAEQVAHLYGNMDLRAHY